MDKKIKLRLMVNLFNHITDNDYPGRFIIPGITPKNYIVLIYGIMGRSFDSRNRNFERDGDNVKTVFADETKKGEGDPELLLYDAMGNLALQAPHSAGSSTEHAFIVTNGKQTTDLLTGMKEAKSFATILRGRKHEPDSNVTPRISAMVVVSENAAPRLELSIIKKAPVVVVDEDDSQHNFFNMELKQPGLGFCISTYMGDGQPLPSFTGEPILVPIEGNSAEEIAKYYWDVLNHDNRVSLAVQVIKNKTSPFEIDWHIINRFEKVVAQ